MSLDLFRIRSYVLGTGAGLVYFAGFTATLFILTHHGDFADAFRPGLIVIAEFVAAALLLALADAATTQRVGSGDGR